MLGSLFCGLSSQLLGACFWVLWWCLEFLGSNLQVHTRKWKASKESHSQFHAYFWSLQAEARWVHWLPDCRHNMESEELIDLSLQTFMLKGLNQLVNDWSFENRSGKILQLSSTRNVVRWSNQICLENRIVSTFKVTRQLLSRGFSPHFTDLLPHLLHAYLFCF